jgi:hypothetical protein
VKLINDVNKISNVFSQHMDVDSDKENEVHFHPSLKASAQFEVRVRLKEATDVYELILVY